jgi:hypothetical protein
VRKTSLLIAAAALSLAAATAVSAAELPTYQANGFPISPVQMGLLGTAHVQGQSQVATTAPSPHQVSVLTPRAKQTVAKAASVRKTRATN